MLIRLMRISWETKTSGVTIYNASFTLLRSRSYYAYDFHHETKGMKYERCIIVMWRELKEPRYERLTELIAQLERIFENQG